MNPKMAQNKTTGLIVLLALILLIPAHAEENTSAPANNTTHEQSSIDKAVETIFFIGIILSPFSFIIAVVALWIALKNRKKIYNIK